MSKTFLLRLFFCIPMGISTLLAVTYVVPKHVGGLSGVMPLVHLIPIFMWGVMSSRDISMIFLVALGLIVDVVTSLPLGLSSLCYGGFFLLTRSQNKYIYKEGFAAMWGYFSLFTLAMQLLGWALYSLYYQLLAPMENAIFQWFFTILIYPFFHALLLPVIEKMSQARYRLSHA